MRDLTDEETEMLRSYLWNDSGGGDIASSVFDEETASAVIVAEEDCVISGIEPAVFIFEESLCSVEVMPGVESGSLCGKGSEIMTVRGPVKGLLKGERIALNILSRMSGIATISQRAAEIVEKASPGTRVAGTRKTTPGFSLMEKRALMDGGALPHRKDMTSLAMLKDNHLSALGGGPGAVLAGVEMIRDLYGPYIPIEVEVEDINSGIAAVEAGADIIMLDNMTPEETGKASERLRAAAEEEGMRIVIEASGGIDPERAGDYALHVDTISMGSVTYGAQPIGFRMVLSLQGSGK